jgi:hypothetical protein
VGVALTARDHELLFNLLKYRYLSTSQVQRLHFPSAQTAVRRMRLLEEAGLVSTFRSTAIADRLASLSRLGAETVAEQLAVPLDQLDWTPRREQPKDYLFLKHFLAAGDFRITLTSACAADGNTRLLGFIPEHLAAAAPTATPKKHVRDLTIDAMDPRHKIAHAPDGVFALKRGPSCALFFLEVDRGTEVLSNPERGVLKTIRFYLSMLVSGIYQRYQTEFQAEQPFRAFRALFVVNSMERLQNIREICGGVPFTPAHAKRFVWLTDESALTDADLLAREWTSLDPTDTRRYKILPSTASEVAR